MWSVLLGGAGTGLWMRFVEPWWFKTTRRTVPIGTGSDIRLLHLSDFHADPMPLEYLRDTIRTAVKLKPDLICCTGDFITRRYDRWSEYAEVLAELSAAAPTFACLGNHDGGRWSRKAGGYSDTDLLRNALATARVRLLHNDATSISVRGKSLNLVGLGDWWAKEMEPDEAFGKVVPTTSIPTVLLSHNPDTKDLLPAYRWDLMLSGHTHGGQLSLPMIGEPFAPIRDKRYVRDLHRWENRWLYITAGVGCLHTARFNCRPEISLLTLT
jgi:predicted MPP superfamily phosphohydrolase